MLKTGLRADKALLVCALTACAGLMDSKKGFKIHALILKHGVGSDVIVGSVLVMLYARCGGFSEAIRIINHMPLVDDFSWSVLIAEYAKHGFIDSAIKLSDCLEKKSVPLWNALIGGYSELGMNEEAHKAFGKMQLEGKKGDEFTYGSLLLASDLVGLSYGEQLHSQTIKLGIDSSVFVGSALIDMYSYNFECEAAIRIFDVLDEPNLVCWNSLISGLGLNKLDGKALCALRLMMVFGLVPDNITLSLILDSCSNLRALREGVQIHTLASKLGLESGVVAGCALIDMYAKCDRIIYASRVFYELQDHSVITWTAIVGGYMRCGMWDEAKELFDIMPERNIVSWNAMISGCVKLGRCTEALQLYHQMHNSGILPDQITLVSLLTICYNFLLKENGKQIHAQVIKNGYHINNHVTMVLTEMYHKLEVHPYSVLSFGSSDPVLGNGTVEPDALSGNN
ncbi:pentatricopeptide repeat-containing protein At2g13600-like [Ananas comosus]|uniref:Pentatricopeptide repeat-containing protein At2g13600-like n=1 Tax=Ananas comosus TaxID=4615 RepID=A0A6P5EN25_ANACO|nr:pentatricopeptide repeat-containing protein At2g13600-like [Ananas comosus]XP_020082720.1 pentatricopeptide repeat-containing protein At2g13600-like [Ananas comosus]